DRRLRPDCCPTRRSSDLHYIHMSGNEVFKFAVRILPEAALEALRRAGVPPERVDLFIPHQANIRIIDAAVKRHGIGGEQVFVNRSEEDTSALQSRENLVC